MAPSNDPQLNPSATSQPQEGTFTLLLFASASTYAGNIETLSLPAPTTLRQVFVELESRFPGMVRKILRSSAITVNLEYVDFDPDQVVEGDEASERGGAKGDEEGEGHGFDTVVKAGDEVGIIPPVSSG